MTNLTPLTVTVQLTLRDIYRANVAITLGRRSPLKWMLYFLVQSAWGSVAFFALFSALNGHKASWIALIWGPLFFTAFAPYLFYGAPYIAARALVRKNPNASKTAQWHFFSDRIEAKGPVSDTVLQWSAFVRIRETKEQFLLYMQEQFANVLPKRSFATVSEIEAFRELIRSSYMGETFLL